MNKANEELRPLGIFASFSEHLSSDASGKYFKEMAKTEPFELIQILRVLVRRRMFKGTCAICKDWYE